MPVVQLDRGAACHRIEQLISAAKVRIQRHRADAEPFSQPCHRQPVLTQFTGQARVTGVVRCDDRLGIGGRRSRHRTR